MHCSPVVFRLVPVRSTQVLHMRNKRIHVISAYM